MDIVMFGQYRIDIKINVWFQSITNYLQSFC